MLSQLRRSHTEYIKKFQSRPDLFFINKRIFYKEFGAMDRDSSAQVKLDQNLEKLTVLGCVVVLIENNSFGYGFFEYSDLYMHKSVKTDLSMVRVEKLNKNHEPSYRSGEDCPSEASLPTLLEIPVCVLKTFNKENLPQAEVSRVHAKFWEYLGWLGK